MLSFQQILLRLLFAAAMGTVIGAERDYHRRPAGVRTSFFVCMASALFTILSLQLGRMWGDSSTTRIASNIVQGIGFLGAGAIIRDSGRVVGLTTAATIFAEAAIGMAVGGGLYAVAGSATAISLFALIVLWWLAERFNIRSQGVLFRFTTTHGENVASEVPEVLRQMKIPMQQFRVSMTGSSSVVEFEAEVNHRQQAEIVMQFKRQGLDMEIAPSDGRRE